MYTCVVVFSFAKIFDVFIAKEFAVSIEVF
jgi:hypothetical protein